MAFAIFDENGVITGLFHSAQIATPMTYSEVDGIQVPNNDQTYSTMQIDDADPRIATFMAAQAAKQTPVTPTLQQQLEQAAELVAQLQAQISAASQE